MRVRPLFVGNFPMHPTPQQIARIVSGTVRGDRVLFNGLPGVHFDTKATHVSIHCIEQYEDGCWVHTFSAKDDPIAIRDFINEQLGNRFVPNKSNGAHCEPSGADIDAAVMAVIAKQERGRVDTKNVVAIYDYRDADETLLYQVRRHETPKSSNPLDNTKTFSYRRPDGRGGWIAEAGERRVPYRWHELLQHPDAAIFVTEGEKDADRVAELNLCATTVASGKWTDDCVKACAGRDVIILEDNDDTGRKKSHEVAARLHPVAKSVRIRRFTDLPEGGDASDWLDAHPIGTCDAFTHFCWAAPLWTPHDHDPDGGSDDAKDSHSEDGEGAERDTKSDSTEPPTIRFTLTAFRDIKLDLTANHYTIKGILPRTGIVLLYGPRKTYKTFVAMDMAMYIARGEGYRGRQVQQRDVVYIGLEGRDGLPARKEALAQYHGTDDVPLHVMITPLNLAKDAGRLILDIKN